MDRFCLLLKTKIFYILSAISLTLFYQFVNMFLYLCKNRLSHTSIEAIIASTILTFKIFRLYRVLFCPFFVIFSLSQLVTVIDCCLHFRLKSRNTFLLIKKTQTEKKYKKSQVADNVSDGSRKTRCRSARSPKGI